MKFIISLSFTQEYTAKIQPKTWKKRTAEDTTNGIFFLTSVEAKKVRHAAT